MLLRWSGLTFFALHIKKPGSRYRSISRTLLNVTEKLTMVIHLTSGIISLLFSGGQAGKPGNVEKQGEAQYIDIFLFFPY